MVWRAALVWAIGLVSVVPYAIYHLLYHAPRDQYALLIVFVAFWIFGYWGLVGWIVATIRIRRAFRAIQQVKSREELLATLASPDARDSAIDLIAAENRIPRFLADRVYRLLLNSLARPAAARGANPAEPL